tara:strand:+ start:20 stop:385 length:366 start_codon:yes stop_codon:yes gene_type:complete
LKEVKSLVLKAFDVLFSLVPFSDFLLLHELSSKDEACLVRSWGQSIFESSLLSHLFNELHLGHRGGQTFSETQLSNGKNFWNIFLVNDVLRGEWVSLGLRLSEDGLHLSSLGFWLFHSDFG